MKHDKTKHELTSRIGEYPGDDSFLAKLIDAAEAMGPIDCGEHKCNVVQSSKYSLNHDGSISSYISYKYGTTLLQHSVRRNIDGPDTSLLLQQVTGDTDGKGLVSLDTANTNFKYKACYIEDAQVFGISKYAKLVELNPGTGKATSASKQELMLLAFKFFYQSDEATTPTLARRRRRRRGPVVSHTTRRRRVKLQVRDPGSDGYKECCTALNGQVREISKNKAFSLSRRRRAPLVALGCYVEMSQEDEIKREPLKSIVEALQGSEQMHRMVL